MSHRGDTRQTRSTVEAGEDLGAVCSDGGGFLGNGGRIALRRECGLQVVLVSFIM